MSTDLTSLYQDVIIEHARRPHNFGPLPEATCTLDGFNPLCGDQIIVHLTLAGGQITDIRFEGSGCAISQASASLMTAAVKGLSREQGLSLFKRVHTMLTVEPAEGDPAPDVGKMIALSSIWEYPTRVKCASLAWQTLRRALNECDLPVETENAP